MKRRVRRFSRKVERKFSEVRAMASNFGRSNSAYNYPQLSIDVTSTIAAASTDSDDDAVFEATTADSPTQDARRTSVTLLPCEFCHLPQADESLTHHQLACQQNPNYRGRRNIPPNATSREHRRRVVSDYISSAPSAPPRTRSPSPIEGFPIPENLQCPITHTLFRDPVVASDGHTYERSAITNWLRQSKQSPITREVISMDKLNPNRLVKKLVDDFLAECRRIKALYKYILDVDIKKLQQLPYIKTNGKTVYRAEWIKKDSLTTDTDIILIHLTGDDAEKTAEIYCQLEPHPNVVQTFGRVKHGDTGILLLQEYSFTQTLSQLINHSNEKLPITILDTILYQIASALRHLTDHDIIHGNVTASNVLIYQLDEIPENILIKLTNIGDIEKANNDTETYKIAPEVLLSNDHHSEKSDVYAFGILAQEMYSLELATNDYDLTERQTLFARCLVMAPNERPTFNELTKSISDLMIKKKFIYPSLNE